MIATVSNKKQKLEEKSTTEMVEDVEKSAAVKETDKKKVDSKEEPMEVTEEIVKPEEKKLENKEQESDTATVKVIEKKSVKKRENTPSTTSEDETETDKAAELMEVTAEQTDEEEDNGLLTACGPVVAASTVADKKPQPQKEEKDNEHESSSDDGANSIYSIHKNSAKTVERLTVTLAKNTNKKTANDRLVGEFEKRCKMLNTMETYIRSILALMQKDEEHANNNEQSGDTDSEERTQLTLPTTIALPNSEVGIMSDSGTSDDDQPLVLPKSPSATPPPLAPLSRGDCGLTISKVTSTATLSKSFNPFKNVDSLSVDDEEEDDEEEEEQSDLNKSSSSAGSSLLANGEEVSTSSTTTQIRSKVASIMSNVASATSAANKESDVISSPASPTEILTAATVDPTQL